MMDFIWGLIAASLFWNLYWARKFKNLEKKFKELDEKIEEEKLENLAFQSRYIDE